MNDYFDLEYTTLNKIIKLIKRNTGETINIGEIVFDDKQVFDYLASGLVNKEDTLFLEGFNTMRMKPKSIDELAAVLWLNSPGREHLYDLYVRKNNHVDLDINVNEYKAIVDPTNGVYVYFDQIIETFEKIGGFSPEQSANARKVLAKKQEDNDVIRNNFIFGNKEEEIPGCIVRGISEENGDNIFSMMKTTACYCGNKSHVMKIAILVYQIAWLKYHYTSEYCAIKSDYKDF